MEYPEKEYPHGELTEVIIGAAFRVHNRLGHSFPEKIYENALVKELKSLGINFEQQKHLTVNYGGEPIGGFVVDLLVENMVVVEIKAVKNIESSFEEKLLHYLKTSGLQVGLLINFGSSVQIKRKVFGRTP
ncbi:MAG: GxxExxY protein [Bacteroidota bacterium]